VGVEAHCNSRGFLHGGVIDQAAADALARLLLFSIEDRGHRNEELVHACALRVIINRSAAAPEN